MKLIKRLPFSIAMVSTLVVTGILVQTHVGELPQDVHGEVAHSPRLLFGGHVHRTLTSVFFTVGGWRFYASILMLAICVSWAESIYGTLRAMIGFFGIHFATVISRWRFALPYRGIHLAFGTVNCCGWQLTLALRPDTMVVLDWQLQPSWAIEELTW